MLGHLLFLMNGYRRVIRHSMHNNPTIQFHPELAALVRKRGIACAMAFDGAGKWTQRGSTKEEEWKWECQLRATLANNSGTRRDVYALIL